MCLPVLAQGLPGGQQLLNGRSRVYDKSTGNGEFMENDKTLNTLLVTLFREIMDIEQEALISGEFVDITVNDMHVIEAIDLGEPRPSSVVAKKLAVTMGTLTKSIDRLTRTGYVLRMRSDEDKRLVLLSLTEKGKKAFDHHKKFHEDMIQAAMGQFNRQEAEILINSLKGLVGYFNGQRKKQMS